MPPTLPNPNRCVSVLALALCLCNSLLSSAASNPTTAVAPQVPVATVKVSGDAELKTTSDAGLVLRLEKPSGRAVIEFNYTARPLDLSAFRDLALRSNNRTSAELDILITGVTDKDSYSSRAQTRFLVRPGEEINLCVMMARPQLPKDHPFVQRLGNLFAFPWGHQRHWQHLDADAIRRVTAQVDWAGVKPGQTITLSRPFGSGTYSVDPALLETLPMPLVDEFGQDRSQTWPGKVQRLEDLREDAAKETALVASLTRPRGEHDRFGGDTRGPSHKATGFFRVEKIDGKWWFIDPEGHLFWSLGVNCVATTSGTRVKGREALFPASAHGRVDINHYEENVKQKHQGKDWRKGHADVTLARMMDWGFNTVGAWSMQELSAARRVPYTLIIHVGYQRIGSNKKIADPYSDEFKNDLERNLAELAALHASSPWLIGVFIDNELEWKTGNALAEEVLGSAPYTPSRLALLAFLRGRYQSLEALNQAWGSSYGSFDSVRPQADAKEKSAYQRDMSDFLTVFADTYFAACAAAMDKHFPNHLYLGCRFHVLNPIVTAAASKHCDVLSVNAYRYGVSDLALVTAVDRPYLISEYHFGTRDYGVWGVGLTWAADARNQSDLVQAYLSDALRHPNLIGAHWFAWAGQAVTGRDDGENFGVGLVTIVDRPEDTLVKAFTDVAEALYDYRLAPKPTRIGAPEAP